MTPGPPLVGAATDGCAIVGRLLGRGHRWSHPLLPPTACPGSEEEGGSGGGGEGRAGGAGGEGGRGGGLAAGGARDAPEQSGHSQDASEFRHTLFHREGRHYLVSGQGEGGQEEGEEEEKEEEEDETEAVSFVVLTLSLILWW